MRTELKLNKMLGITNDGELIMVAYLFNDKLHEQPFHGATGRRFIGITQAEIDDYNDIDNVIENYGYLWQAAVENGSTEESKEEFIQSLIDNCDGYYLGHDDSYISYIPDTIKKMHYDGCVKKEHESIVSRYVNLKYQPISEREQITQDFLKLAEGIFI